MTKRSVIWSALAAVVVIGLGVAGFSGGDGPPSRGQRVAALADEVRCPTCQGLSASESDAKAATAVRAEIARRVDAGESDAEIRQALVDRYGKEILLTPEAGGLGSLVWAIPVAALVVAAGALAWKFSRRSRSEGGLTGRRWIGPAVAAGIGVVAVAGGWAVASVSGERLAGDSVTGSIERGPTELLAEARTLFLGGQVVDALRRYDQVLEIDPTQPEALAYRGWLVRLAGRSEDGLALIDAAIESDPDYPDASLFRGVILLEDKSDPSTAATELRRFLALSPEPELAERGRQTLARAEAQSAPS